MGLVAPQAIPDSGSDDPFTVNFAPNPLDGTRLCRLVASS